MKTQLRLKELFKNPKIGLVFFFQLIIFHAFALSEDYKKYNQICIAEGDNTSSEFRSCRSLLQKEKFQPEAISFCLRESTSTLVRLCILEIAGKQYDLNELENCRSNMYGVPPVFCLEKKGKVINQKNLIPTGKKQYPEIDCQKGIPPILSNNNLKFIEYSFKAINWNDFFSASPEQVKNPVCQKNIPSISQMENWIKEKSASSTNVRNWKKNGVRFINQSMEEARAFEELMTNKSFMNTTEYKLNTKCESVLCAAKEMFGKEEGVMLLYLQMRYKVNASYFANSTSVNKTIEQEKNSGNIFLMPERSKQLSVQDLQNLTYVLANLPESFFPFKKTIRFKKGDAVESGEGDFLAFTSPTGLLGNGRKDVKLVNSPKLKATQLGEIYSIFHEFGHVIGLEFDDSDEWLKASQNINDKGEKITSLNCLTSTYGASSDLEDFAESFVAYRLNPHEMKKKCPSKYNYLKDKVFRGVEFLSKNDCR